MEGGGSSTLPVVPTDTVVKGDRLSQTATRFCGVAKRWRLGRGDAMMHRDRHTAVTLVLALAAVVFVGGACEKPAPPPETSAAPQAFHVTAIDLGKALTADRHVASPMATFSKTDTIYVSVSTEGATTNALVTARFTFGPNRKLVNELAELISPTGPAATEFHIIKPSGWAAGWYKVEIKVNGTAAGSKDFAVQ